MDGVEVLNSVLSQLGFSTGIHPDAWLSEMRRRRPAAILHMRSIQVDSPKSAHLVAQHTSHQLLDLMALKRGATPRIIGGAIGAADDNGLLQFLGSWVEGAGYTGNLMGGFLAGEEPRALLNHWQGMQSDARLKLWLSLYADALADERWEYRLFRCFNLLEGIATQAVPKKKTIVDSAGTPRLKSDGKPYTTAEARGKAYDLLQLVAAVTNQAESNFLAQKYAGSTMELWDELDIWVSVRNAVAHRGSWELPAGATPTARHAAVELEITSRGHDQTLSSGQWAVVRAIRVAVESCLFAGLQGKL
ncbi:hypothetical protein [Kitasatospora sp. NBC_01302]|uniref:hypothetical protein n=1 Tax=Kitasatospora sp. NBC_01302 TaxID=2903575 RepID=UPI002E1601EC|nr:hypothetical protein OG294_33240 [Kitasatospora sp. NBC_01302]